MIVYYKNQIINKIINKIINNKINNKINKINKYNPQTY